MPEFLNFVENFRQNVVNRGYVSDKTYEKREARDATKMLSSFLFNVLKDNQNIIAHQEYLLETTTDENQKIRKEEQIDRFI